MRIMFVEPPKDFWFVMGEYLPPPLGILNLAAYLREHEDSIEIVIVDCNAERISWSGLQNRIESYHPDVVAPSSLSTCNAYRGLRSIGIAKTVDPSITTIMGGQHYTVLAKESLEAYPELDIVVRGEGEQTLLELTQNLSNINNLKNIEGITFRNNNQTIRRDET